MKPLIRWVSIQGAWACSHHPLRADSGIGWGATPSAALAEWSLYHVSEAQALMDRRRTKWLRGKE